MKKITKLCLFLMIVLLAVSVTACNRDRGEDGEREVDHTKTQLYVSSYNGGFGVEWLDKLILRFEEQYKDVSFEDGKMGVQVHIDPAKDDGTAISELISTSRNDVFFTEHVYYYDFVNKGLVADITDIVTEELTAYGETGTIEEKFNKQQKDFYKTTDGKYYGIPHYSAYSGIMYDIDLFEKKGFYFAADNSLDATKVKYNTDINNGNNGFIFDKTEKRSNGPDGLPNTYDDGLPSTYEEFFLLCDYIKGAGCTPVIWNGEYRHGYVQAFLQALGVDYEGLDQMTLNYTFDGVATNLVSSIDSNGNVNFSEPVTITDENGYEMYRSAGRYYAIDFYQRLTSNTSYHHGKCFNGTQNHKLAQQDFLFSSPEGLSPIAMLLDGIWWENESKDVFADLAAQYGSQYGRNSRNFGLMPLPKATSDKVGEAYTVLDTHYSLGFINANCTGIELELAKKFLQFANTEVSLREFTTTTNTPKALTYTMTDNDLQQMSPFGKNVWSVRENCDVVYPFSQNPIFLNNQAKLIYSAGFESKISNTVYNQIADDIRGSKTGHITSENYFNGIKNNFSNSWWSENFSKYFK